MNTDRMVGRSEMEISDRIERPISKTEKANEK